MRYSDNKPSQLYTDEQLHRANETNLESFLLSQGEKLLPAGREKRLASDKSIVIRDNTWYDHAAEKGGLAINLLQHLYNLPFREAVSLLIGEQGDTIYPTVHTKDKIPEPKKPFFLPERFENNNRVAAYLCKTRLIAPDVVREFLKNGLIYEEVKHHNVVFVGRDSQNIPRHAHQRSAHSEGNTFRINVGGCDPDHSFHWQGKSNRLYVFEAPIDLLSYISLNRENWQEHGYVSLCGVASYAMLEQLRRNPAIDKVVLCTDYDSAGIEAAGRLRDTLREQEFKGIVIRSQSMCKDWNEDIKFQKGLEAESGIEHPQLILCKEQEKRMALRLSELRRDIQLRQIKEQQRRLAELRKNHDMGRCAATLEDMALLAILLAHRKYHHLGVEVKPREMLQKLCAFFQPHRNKTALDNQIKGADGFLTKLLTVSKDIPTETEVRHQIADLGRFAVHCLNASITCRMVLEKELAQEQVQSELEEDRGFAEPTMELVMG